MIDLIAFVALHKLAPSWPAPILIGVEACLLETPWTLLEFGEAFEARAAREELPELFARWWLQEGAHRVAVVGAGQPGARLVERVEKLLPARAPGDEARIWAASSQVRLGICRPGDLILLLEEGGQPGIMVMSRSGATVLQFGEKYGETLGTSRGAARLIIPSRTSPRAPRVERSRS